MQMEMNRTSLAVGIPLSFIVVKFNFYYLVPEANSFLLFSKTLFIINTTNKKRQTTFIYYLKNHS